MNFEVLLCNYYSFLYDIMAALGMHDIYILIGEFNDKLTVEVLAETCVNYRSLDIIGSVIRVKV